MNGGGTNAPREPILLEKKTFQHFSEITSRIGTPNNGGRRWPIIQNALHNQLATKCGRP
jgi:hypothetical protein